MYYCKCNHLISKIKLLAMPFSEISLGSMNQVQSTLDMFVAITDHLLDAGIDQWNYDYPDLSTLTLDVNLSHNYVIEKDGRIEASIVINEIQDEQYKNVKWTYNGSKILVIHRLGVHPNSQGKGLGKKMCQFAEWYARTNAYTSIRLDAYAGNERSNQMYRSLGYSQAQGLCYFRNKSIPFYCYEKIIK